MVVIVRSTKKVCCRISMSDSEHVELVEPCIICFEGHDDRGTPTVCSKDIVVARDCACDYAIHRTCWEHWMDQRPLRHYGLRCLVCASPIERRRSRSEIIAEFIDAHEAQSAKACRYSVYLVGFIFFLIIMLSPYD